MNLPRKRRTPKHPRGARLAGAPVHQPVPAPAPAPEIAIEPEKPKKRAARKRAPKPEVDDE